MKSFLIKDDDIVIENGNLKMIDNDLELCQCVERTLTTRLEEFFLNLEHGMNYDDLHSKSPDIEHIKIDISDAVLQEERVKLIEKIDVEIDRANRKAKIYFVFRTIDDELLEGEVII
ncbi:MAG: hypothetical protein ACTTHM_04690 [Peptoanaerobacter stomatis]|uniref:hypothetical protein n=1 Tax=Peptoanaerobacter stomatis TaxID=796937 RepID=UPI003F9F6CEC